LPKKRQQSREPRNPLQRPSGDKPSRDSSDPAHSIERSILQIVRGMGRRNIGRGAERKLEGLVDFSHVAIIDALSECEEAGVTATVGHLARRIGADPSRASRMTAKAIRAGYAKRLASQEDGRRACVALTKRGEDFRDAISDLRRRYFASQLKSLSRREQETLAELLSKFVQAVRQKAGGESLGDLVAAEPAADAAVVLLHPATPKRRRE
jgi:DNA-binding MarR family transcriptional regulator